MFDMFWDRDIYGIFQWKHMDICDNRTNIYQSNIKVCLKGTNVF